MLGAAGHPVAEPTGVSQRQAQAKVRTTPTTALGPNLNTFNLAASMDRLNAMRIATPADELA